MLDGCCFSLEDSTVVFHLEEVLCDGVLRRFVLSDNGHNTYLSILSRENVKNGT